MRADYATSDLISKVNSDWINEVLANREFGRADPGDDVARDDIPRDDIPRDDIPRDDIPRDDIPRDNVPRDDVADDVPADQVYGDEVRANNDGAGDLRLRREFARKRAVMLRRGSTRIERHEPDVTVDPIARLSPPRSVARRVKERLALAVAALAVAGVGVWMAPEPQDVTNSVAARAASAPPEPATPIETTDLQPGWLLPEILYGPAMARSPVPRVEASRPVPKTGH
jgi:hypothetical protein